MADKTGEERELTAEEQAQLAELDEALKRFESQKRWSDYIRTLVKKADLVPNAAEKIELLTKAGALYVDRSANQAEAIKCYERVIELDRHHREAIGRLKEMYEKRRDWERLVAVMRNEAELLDEGERLLQYERLAEMATERVRKPQVCVELWQLVLESDPTNPKALQSLVGLHERAREWGPLAKVLETLIGELHDPAQLKQELQKLGLIYAEKIGDDEGAVRTFTRLLELDPDDKRAQEQLKRRYVALKAWDKLEEFYAPQDKWDELIRVLEREAESNEATKEVQIDLHFRVARLWMDKKDKADRAAKAYEKVLSLDAENLDAAEALSPIYERVGDAANLARVYEVRLGHLEDTADRVALLRETGLLYETKLSKADLAFDRYLEAFELDPSQELLREDVQRAASAVNGWDRLAEAYKKAIKKAESEDDELALRTYFGQTLRQLGKTEDAIKQFRAVYDAAPDHTGAIQALGELYRETQNHRELLDIYERRLELEDDADVRRTLAYGRATLFEEDLGETKKAVDAYIAILEEFGDDETNAFRALDRLYVATKQHRDLAGILERRIELGREEPAELATLKYRLGRLLETDLDDKERAVETYREVLTMDPDHEGARVALEGLLDDKEVGLAAAEILEPIYEGREDWPNLVRAVLVLARGESDADRKHALLVKVAEVRGTRLGDANQSFDALAAALRALPRSLETLQRLEMLAVEQDRFAELVALVAELGGAVDDPDLARALWLKAAEFYATQLGNMEGSIAAYERILAQDPGDVEVLDQLENLHRRTERWPALVEVLRKKVQQTTDASVQLGLLAQMAHIQDEMLQQPQQAIQILSEILDLDPSNDAALSALDRLYERLQMWSELADNLDRQLALTDDPARQVEIKLRAADVRERHMGSTEAAVEIYRDILHQDASEARALAALERLLADAKHQVAVAEVLEPVYLEANEFAKLIGVHEIQIRHADSSERRVEILQRIAELYEMALDNVTSAFETYARAFAEDPVNEHTTTQLDRLAAVTGNFEGLSRVYSERVGQIEDPSLVAQVHFKIATIRHERLNDVPGAIQHYQKVLEVEADNVAAATALEQLYQVSERYDDLAGIYRRKASMIPDPDERKQYLFRAAAAYEELLQNADEAVRTYELALEVDPEDVGALNKLIEIHRRGGRWPELLQAYSRKIDVVSDVEEKKALLAEVGAVYEGELKDQAKAVDTYQRILEIDPEDVGALGRLDVLYQATENWEELLSVLEREAELQAEPEAAVEFRFRVAELWRTKLSDAGRAVDIYREILEVMPEHGATIQALETMMDGTEEPVAAAGVLDPLYRSAGEWARLARVLEVQVKHEDDPVRTVELFHELATLYEEQMNDAEKAFDAYRRALPTEPENEVTLGSLERIAEQLQCWDAVGELYDGMVTQLADNEDARANLAMRAAQVYEAQLGNASFAIERYKRVLEADPARTEAVEALDRLYEATEQWSELAEILSREIEVAASPEAILNLQFRLGQVMQHRLGRVSDAIKQYREILGAAPEYVQALTALEGLFASGVNTAEIAEVLEPHYRMQEQWDRLIQVHEKQIESVSGKDERVQLMHRIAETAEERAGDAELAFHWMQRALAEDPTHDHSLGEVERLATGLDGWVALAGTYAAIAADKAQGAADRVAMAKRGARVLKEELDDLVRAEEMYRYILTIDPNDADALAELASIYESFGAHEALASTLRRRIQAVEFPEEKVALSYQLGQVLQHDLAREGDAIEVYNDVIGRLEPEHSDSIRALESIYASRQDWPMLFKIFEKELEIVHGDQAQADVLSRMAYIAFHTLNQPEKAVELWRRVLDLKGEDPEALNALGDVLASQGRWEELVDVLEREAGALDDDARRVAVSSDLARITYEKLGKERAALDAWERVLDIDPMHAQALYNIAEIHRAAKRQQEFADTLRRIVELGEQALRPDQLSNVYMQLGYVYWAGMEQPADAIEAYEKAIDLNPHNHEALDAMEHIHRSSENWEGAIQVMERRVDALTQPAAIRAQLLSIARMWAGEAGNADGGTRAYQRILERDPLDDYAFGHLEELHAKAGRWEDLVEMYLNRLDITEDGAQRIELLRKVARVYEEKLNDGPNAYEALKFAWSADFTNKGVALDLERVTRETNSWNDLLSNANSWLREATEPHIKIAICLNCARWYGTGIGRRDYAIPYFEQINQLDPNNVESKQELAELYHTTQQYDHERQVLEGLVTLTSDPNVKADTYVKVGDLCRGPLGLPEQAQAYYQSALAESPNHIPALEALSEVHRERGQWQELLTVLKRKVRSLHVPAEVAEAKLQVATLYENELESPEEAILAYREVREIEPTDLHALRGLDRLYTAAERWQELVEVLETSVGVVHTERERIGVLTRLAGMWDEQFVKPEKAVERLEQVLEIDAHHTGALAALERLYRQLQDWERLMHTLERHGEATPERDEKGRIHRAMAELYAHELANLDRAVDCYLAALDIEENDVDALEGLTRVYEKRGDFSQAVEMMERVAKLSTDRARQVDLWFRMGRIRDAEFGERAQAVEAYQNAIDLDPTHVASLEALAKIHVDSGDWLAAARALEQEAEHRTNARQAAKTLVELGRIYRDKLEETEQATACFAKALAKDPDNEDAAMPLAADYAAAERWQEAYPILEMLFRRIDKRDAEEQRRIAMQFGEAATKVGDKEGAVKAFSRAYQADSQDLQALVALANAYYAAEAWADAFKYFQMVLVHHRENLSKQETTDVFYKLGGVKRAQGEIKKAINMFDKALEEDGYHRPTIEALIGIYSTRQDGKAEEWEKVIHYKRLLVDVAETDDERFALLKETGDLWRDKVKNVQKAIQAYTDASGVKPDEHKLLHELLKAYQETRQWDRAVDIIQQISDLETRAPAKSKYSYTVGVILRDEIKDLERSVQKFEEALDQDWENLKAFEALNKVHTQRKDWKQLERAFRKMLHRAVGKGNKDLEFFLWHNLGVIYRDRLQNYESAVEAFKMAASQKPEDQTEHQILAELYAMMPNRIEDAIGEHQLLLRQDPQRVDSYRALYRLYFDAQMHDKAWCLAAALVFFNKADAEQKRFYEQYKPAQSQMTARLDNTRWVKGLFHPDESLYVGKLLEPLSFGVLAAKASPDKALHLLKKYEVDPATATVMFARLYGAVAQILNLQYVPRLFLRPDHPGPFLHVPGSNPPAVMCMNSFLSGFTPAQLGFVIGRQLAYYRGEHFIRTLITSHTELKTILLAGLQIAGVVPSTPDVAPTAQALQARLGAAQMDALRAIAKTFVEAEPNADVKKWMQSVELTACRAGFLFCNDLTVAAQMIQSLPGETTVDLPPKEKIKELVLFSVSEQYFQLREYLGLRIRI